MLPFRHTFPRNQTTQLLMGQVHDSFEPIPVVRQLPTRFAMAIVMLVNLGWLLMLLIEIGSDWYDLDDPFERGLRFVIWTTIFATLNVMALRMGMTWKIRLSMLFALLFAVLKLWIDWVRVIPFWNHVPIIGAESDYNRIMAQFGLGGAICSVICAKYFILRAIDRECRDIQALAHASAGRYGDPLLSTLVVTLGRLLKAGHVAIYESVLSQKKRSRILAWWNGKQIQHGLDLELDDLPCLEVQQGHMVHYPCRTAERHPRLTEILGEPPNGYLGIPLRSSRGQVLGHMAVIDSAPISAEIAQRLSVQLAVQQAAAELERRQADERLQRGERLVSLGRFAAGIAHEINNPLWIILLQIEVAKKALAADDPHAMRETLDNIGVTAERASRTVKSILQFARHESSQKSLEELHDIACRAIDFSRGQAETKGVVVTLRHTEHLPAVRMNGTAIEQAVINLLLNAIDASPHGSQVTLDIHRHSGSARLTVTDCGTGIPDHQRPYIFDPFFTTRFQEGGTGLGLCIVYGIVSDHSGQLHVQSEVGKGTVFSIDLPLNHHDESPR